MLNEYEKLTLVAVRAPESAYVSEQKIDTEWQALRFHERPDLTSAIDEHAAFVDILASEGAEVITFSSGTDLTLDGLYTRDAMIQTPDGILLCNMGRVSRRGEPRFNMSLLEEHGITEIGTIEAPGTIEGGDVIWLDDKTLAVGLGPRTNMAGIEQLKALLAPNTDLHVVPLPAPDHADDVYHLMSMISPLDRDLALVHSPDIPNSFSEWLTSKGITQVEVDPSEFLAMACNVLALGPRRVLMLEGLPMTKARLEAAGCTVLTYKGIEISRKGEGGPTCLTRPLKRLP